MCNYRLIGICFTQPPASAGDAIFGFGDFLTALALLVLVYNSADPLYRFRINVAPIRLFPLTFWTTLVVGGGSLLTDLWFAERWYAPAWGVSRAEIQAGLGLLFLVLVSAWTWFAFVRPASFAKLNAKAYFLALYRAIVRGSEKELAAVASELSRSGKALVRYAAEHIHRFPGEKVPEPREVTKYATQALLLLGNRKLCRQIVATSPETAIVIMQEARAAEKYRLPLGQFAQNLTTEALLNRDSSLYHEDGLSSGLAGHWKPFTNTVYGDFQLVAGMEGGSPFDIDYRVRLSPEEFDAYCRVVLCTFKSYVDGGWYESYPHAFGTAMRKVTEYGSGDLHKIDKLEDYYPNDAEARFSRACRFIQDALGILDKKDGLQVGKLRLPGKYDISETIIDVLAEAASELISAASRVREPKSLAWHIQHNTAWAFFTRLGKRGPASRAFRIKLARLLYKDILELEKFPNFKGAGVLYVVLNCTALGNYISGRRRADFPIGRAVLAWTHRNYMRLAEVHPPIAQRCISPAMTFDKDRARIVRVFDGGLNLNPQEVVLDLARWTSPGCSSTPETRRVSRPRRRRAPAKQQ